MFEDKLAVACFFWMVIMGFGTFVSVLMHNDDAIKTRKWWWDLWWIFGAVGTFIAVFS